MSQADKATRFAALHVKGAPLELYNIWDAGSAKAVAEAGAPALATGSWSVAAAQGYADGEALPLDLLLTIAARITATVDLPLTLDFEGGYTTDPATLSDHIARVIAAGAIGVNFEDRVVQGAGLHPVEAQAARIAAIRQAAESAGVPLFLNARTDLFLGTDPATHADRVQEAIARAQAYAEAGASGFFIPGLTDLALITEITAAVALPVNVLVTPDLPDRTALAKAGIARISHGPGPYRRAMAELGAASRAATW